MNECMAASVTSLRKTVSQSDRELPFLHQHLFNPTGSPSALPISVTTESRADPRSEYSNGLASKRRRSGYVLSNDLEAPLNPIQLGLDGLVGSKTLGGIAFRGGGITLPKKRPCEHATEPTITPFVIAPQQARKVVTITSAPQLKSRIALKSLMPSTVVSDNQTVKTNGYSSACRASVNAHQLALKRSAHSAPGLVGLSVSSDISPDKSKYKKVVGGKPAQAANARRMSLNDVSPQVFLDNMLKSRGYSTQNFCSIEGAYYCKPTALQKASYGVKLIEAIRRSDEVLLKKMLQAGISPNPCNAFGESAVHMVCRRGDYKLLKLFKDHGCSLQVTDDFGRTPLHDACWTTEPPFQIVDMILTADRRLLHLVDCRGSSPLSYVGRDNWAKWIEFFQSRADTYWPPVNVANEGDESPPSLCWEAPHTRPIPDPPHAISIDAAQRLVTLGDDSIGERPNCSLGLALPTAVTSATME